MSISQSLKEKKISLAGLKINYKTQGQGPPILICHGWAVSSDSWLKVQEILAQKGYQAICPDWPGFGKSELPSRPWEVGDYANFLLDFIRGLGLEKFFLLGHSFGGRVAIKFAAQYPEKLKGLILVDSAGIDREKNLDLRQKMVFRASKLSNFLLSLPFSKRFYPFLRKLGYVLAGTSDFYLIKELVMRETFKKVVAEDLTPRLSQIKSPTLIIWGERDKLTPVQNAYLIQEKIKNSKLEILKNIGHGPHLKAPEILCQKIINFINKHA